MATVIVPVLELKAGDELGLGSRRVEVLRVETITPGALAGLEFDDNIHGSGEDYARIYYTRFEPTIHGMIESHKDVPLGTKYALERWEE